ncbi:hypothetical protein EDB19DRAFT_1762139 [Suillus lakei]|nr:hypothetical protein EDB19DRAFT_1762139 [Suillus lakei]
MRRLIVLSLAGGFFFPLLDRPVGNIVLYHTQVKSDFFAMMFERRKESGCAMSVWQGLAMLFQNLSPQRHTGVL